MLTKLIFITTLVAANMARAASVYVSIGDIYPYGSAKPDTLQLEFDDSAGAKEIPYWLNGFADDHGKTGYVGILRSKNFDYQSTVYFSFNADKSFNLFEECSLAVKCYLALAAPTSVIKQQVSPTQPGQLASYLSENLSLITSLVGTNGGWQVSINTPPTFPETFPRLLTIKTNSIQVSSVPEASTSALGISGILLVLITRRAKRVKVRKNVSAPRAKA